MSAAGTGYCLVKNWDFVNEIRDLTTLRQEFFTRFIYNKGTLDYLNDDWSRYRDNNNHVFTKNGLALTARSPSAPAPGEIESGMLRSAWYGQYGIYEICMKVPPGLGLCSAFWLTPQDASWPPEIDVVEIINNGYQTTKQSFHFLHGIGADHTQTYYSKLATDYTYTAPFDYSAGFHVFSLEWTSNRLRHYVDSTLVADREYYWIHDDKTDGGPAHIVANLSCGGNWTGNPSGQNEFPTALEIQYIRVWQQCGA